MKSNFNMMNENLINMTDLLKEIQLLKDLFMANGYPKKLVDKTINQSWKV